MIGEQVISDGVKMVASVVLERYLIWDLGRQRVVGNQQQGSEMSAS